MSPRLDLKKDVVFARIRQGIPVEILLFERFGTKHPREPY